jgi:nucleotide-binding universal stress UspA family protein
MSARTAGGNSPQEEASGRVVVGFDDSEGSRNAIRWAAGEAVRRNLTLRIATAFGPNYVFTSDEECRTYMDKVADLAVREAEEAAPGVRVEHSGHRELPGSALHEESKSADLLVVGSRGRGGFTGLLLGSVSRQCIHRSACPVVVVRPSQSETAAVTKGVERAGEVLHPEGQEPEGRRIVVGVDGSPSSNAGLLWAADEADAAGATLELVHVWEWLTGSGWAVVPSDFDPQQGAETLLSESAETVGASHPTLGVSMAAVEGRAADRLVDASNGAELLVVGCRGHGELSGMVLGSVSDYCATHAHCPVLVMRGAHADVVARH